MYCFIYYSITISFFFLAHSDFNTEVISVTFPADENSTGSMITTEAFTVHIVDDNIVEAFRQFYLLVTEITDAVQPDEIDLFAPDMSLTDIALVIIFDDDCKLKFRLIVDNINLTLPLVN